MTKKLFPYTLFVLLGLSMVAHAEDPVIVLSAAKKSGAYFAIGQRLQSLLSKHRIDSGILASAGSLENLKRLADPDHSANIALTQADALQYYLSENAGFQDKIAILDKVGKECVFIIASAKGDISSDSDLQDDEGRKLAILSPDSGVAVTYEYMSRLEPDFRNTAVTYMDTMTALEQLGSGENSPVQAVMLVQRPRARTPELKRVLENPGTYRLVAIDDSDLDERLPDGDAVYTFEDIAVVRGEGNSTGVSVETICTEALVVAATEKINPGMLTILETVLEQQWMLIYPD